MNPSVQKLCYEKANMQMSVYVPRPVLAAFKYHACMSRYLKATDGVNDPILASFAHRG